MNSSKYSNIEKIKEKLEIYKILFKNKEHQEWARIEYEESLEEFKPVSQSNALDAIA